MHFLKYQLTVRNLFAIIDLKLTQSNYKGGENMFDFSELILMISKYGFNNLCKDSEIKIERLIDILDGILYFKLSEINIISFLLKISEDKQDRIFFTKKVD